MKRWGILLCAACAVCALPVQAEERFSGSKMTTLFGTDEEGSIITLAPSVLLDMGDYVAAWTSSDVLEDEVQQYLVTPDVNSSPYFYEAEYVDANSSSRLSMFRLENGQDGLAEETKKYEMVKAYSDEVLDCYFFDDEFYECHLTVQLTGYDVIDELYFASYKLVNPEEVEQVSSIQGPGMLIDENGDCAGLLCPQSVEEHDLLLFAEPIQREGADTGITAETEKETEKETEAEPAADTEEEAERWEANGNLYIGHKVNGNIHGWGACLYEDGDLYVGEWDNGLFSGEGHYYWPDGDYYKGSFVDDEICGIGTYYWANQNWYTGEWEDGVRHGSGTMHFADGTSEERVYEQGEWVE